MLQLLALAHGTSAQAAEMGASAAASMQQLQVLSRGPQQLQASGTGARVLSSSWVQLELQQLKPVVINTPPPGGGPPGPPRDSVTADSHRNTSSAG